MLRSRCKFLPAQALTNHLPRSIIDNRHCILAHLNRDTLIHLCFNNKLSGRSSQSFLVSRDLTNLGIYVDVSPGRKPVLQFRCLNTLTVGVTSSLIATIISWLVSRVWP